MSGLLICLAIMLLFPFLCILIALIVLAFAITGKAVMWWLENR
jgi:hypothetical protein